MIFENVSFSYENHPVLHDISCHITPGEFVSIIGPSGSGKSTFLSLCSASRIPTQGNILTHDGEDICRMKSRKNRAFRQKIGIVFQDYRLLEKKTAQENVAFAGQVLGMGRELAWERAGYLLEQVGLCDKKNCFIGDISGGEAQRVAIARALINDPNIIIADEPTGNLDPVQSHEIIAILQDLHTQGKTIILSTHDNEIVNFLNQRVIVLRDGKLIRDMPNGGYELQ